MINFINVLQNLWPLLLVIFGLLVVAMLNYHAALEVGKVKQLAVDCMTDAAKSRIEISKLLDTIREDGTHIHQRHVDLLDTILKAAIQPPAQPHEHYLVSYVWIAATGLGGCRYGFDICTDPTAWTLKKLSTGMAEGYYLPTQFLPLTPELYEVLAAHPAELPTKI